MSKFYEIKDALSLSSYAKKYNITLRKIYRYIGDNLIEHYMIDGVAFLPDREIKLLKDSHTRNQLLNDVKILTRKEISVKNLTEYNNNIEKTNIKTTVNQGVNSVLNLTESSDNNVKILTLKKSELELIAKHDDMLNTSELKTKYDLIKKYLA